MSKLVRLVGFAGLLVVLQATSCLGPGVYVFREYVLATRPDSAFQLPNQLYLPIGTFARPEPKRHWWSDEPRRPVCGGFTLYELAGQSLNRLPGQATMASPYSVELRLKRGATPSLVVWYMYYTPVGLAKSSTSEGQAQVSRIAELDSIFAATADTLVRIALAGAGVEPVSAPKVSRPKTWKERDAMCSAAANSLVRQ